jgi:von Willebrand factor type A domain
MPNPELTDIVIVLDRSGSMESVRDATIEAFNAYVSSQLSGPGEARLTLIQFDDRYEPVCHNVPISNVPKLDRERYQPRGSTALYDAVGKTISDIGLRYSQMLESRRPDKVLFVIQTDGMENASTKYTGKQINDMIAIQRDQYSWQFVFLGANQDAIATGARFGIAAGASLGYGANNAGTKAAFDVLGRHTMKYRQARNAETEAWAFAETDRRQTAGED